MAKVGNIVKAFAFPIPRDEKWWQDRIAICNDCPLNSRNGAELNLVQKATQSSVCGGGDVCSSCGCCTERKASVEDESCPKGKWGTIIANNGGNKDSNFTIQVIDINHKIKFDGMRFTLDLGDVKTNKVTTELKIQSKLPLTYRNSEMGCSCTTDDFKSLDHKNFYTKVSISAKIRGFQSKTVKMKFITSNRGERVLPLTISFNKK